MNILYPLFFYFFVFPSDNNYFYKNIFNLFLKKLMEFAGSKNFKNPQMLCFWESCDGSFCQTSVHNISGYKS